MKHKNIDLKKKKKKKKKASQNSTNRNEIVVTTSYFIMFQTFDTCLLSTAIARINSTSKTKLTHIIKTNLQTSYIPIQNDKTTLDESPLGFPLIVNS